MKKVILLLMAILVIMPMTGYGFGFLNITNAQLTRLDASTFRLRVSYDWGGDMLAALMTDTNLYGPPSPMLESFSLTGGGTQFNLFNQSATASMYRKSGLTYAIQSTGNQFGYDFSADDPLISSFTFSDQGRISWYSSNQLGMRVMLPPLYQFSEDFHGQFTLPIDPSAVPEPASLVLMGLGLAGAIIVKKRK